MIAAIEDVIRENVTAYGPKSKRMVVYTGVDEVARELEISYEAANKLIQNWIDENY